MALSVEDKHAFIEFARLGRFYARALAASGLAPDVLSEPAYKGIPFAAAMQFAGPVAPSNSLC